MSHEPVKERQINIMKEGGATRGPIVMDWDMLKEVEAFLKDHPDSFKAWVARGILYFNEDFEKAIESLSHALAIDPFNGDQYYNRGRKFLSQDRYPQALADLTMATRLDDGDAWKWHFRGVAYYFLDQFEEAIECFERGIEWHVKNGTNNTPPEKDWIFMAYLNMGNKEKAFEAIADMNADTLVEPGDLMYLKRCLLYKGETSIDDFDKDVDRSMAKRIITELYGAVVYCHYLAGDDKRAAGYLKEILDVEEDHHAFGYKMALLDKATWAKDLL